MSDFTEYKKKKDGHDPDNENGDMLYKTAVKYSVSSLEEFGLSQHEVSIMLARFGLSDYEYAIRRWFGGYAALLRTEKQLGQVTFLFELQSVMSAVGTRTVANYPAVNVYPEITAICSRLFTNPKVKAFDLLSRVRKLMSRFTKTAEGDAASLGSEWQIAEFNVNVSPLPWCVEGALPKRVCLEREGEFNHEDELWALLYQCGLLTGLVRDGRMDYWIPNLKAFTHWLDWYRTSLSQKIREDALRWIPMMLTQKFQSFETAVHAFLLEYEMIKTTCKEVLIRNTRNLLHLALQSGLNTGACEILLVDMSNETSSKRIDPGSDLRTAPLNVAIAVVPLEAAVPRTAGFLFSFQPEKVYGAYPQAAPQHEPVSATSMDRSYEAATAFMASLGAVAKSFVIDIGCTSSSPFDCCSPLISVSPIP